MARNFASCSNGYPKGATMRCICAVAQARWIPMALLTLIALLESPAQGQLGGGGTSAAPSPPRDHVSSLAFAADGSLLAGAGVDKIRVWEMKRSQLVRTVTTGGPSVTDIGFSPKEKLLAAACGDGQVRLWDTETGQLAKTLEVGDDTAYFVAFSSSGKLMASTHRRHHDPAGKGKPTARFRLWNITRGNTPRTLVDGEADFVASPAFSPDDRHLAAVKVWHTDTRLRTEIHIGNVDTDESARTLSLDPTNPRLLRFFPDGQSLVTVGRRTAGACTVGEMRRWDLKSGKTLWWIEDLHSGVDGIAISPDGLTVASIGIGPWKSFRWRENRPITSGSELVLRDAANGRVLARAEGEGNGRTAVAFSSDGSLLATCDDQQVALRDAKTGAVQQVLWPFPGTP